MHPPWCRPRRPSAHAGAPKKSRNLALGLAAAGALLVLISAVLVTLLFVPPTRKKPEPNAARADDTSAPGPVVTASASAQAAGEASAPLATASDLALTTGTAVESAKTLASSKPGAGGTSARTSKPRTVVCKKDRYTLRCPAGCARCD